jgi:dTDP-4-amino-4,6-dideoxygalactose transaminase
MIPRTRPDVEWSDLWKMLASPVGRPEIFEHAFTNTYPNLKQVVWFPHARVAVRAYLESLQSARSEVVVSPFNCVALGNAILASGSTPRYVDTEEHGFNQNPSEFLEALNLSSVKAGIVVPMWGDESGISSLSVASKPILYDFAMGGLNPFTPELNLGDALLYSFNPGKPVMSLQGGMLCGTSEAQVRGWRRWRDIRLNGGNWTNDLWSALKLKMVFHPLLFTPIYEVWKRLPGGFAQDEGTSSELMPKGWNEIPSRAVFALGAGRFGRLNALRQERSDQIARYLDFLSPLIPMKGDLFQLPNRNSSLSHFPIRSQLRDELHQYLLSKGVFTSTRIYDRLLCDYEWLKGVQSGGLERARGLVRTTLQLPLFTGLSAQDQMLVAEALKSWASLPALPSLQGARAL